MTNTLVARVSLSLSTKSTREKGASEEAPSAHQLFSLNLLDFGFPISRPATIGPPL